MAPQVETQPKAVEPVAASPYPSPTGCLKATAAIAGIVCLLAITGAVVVFVIVSLLGDKDGGNKPDIRPDSALVRDLERVGVEASDALYFSKFCRGVAVRLDASTLIDTRGEALALYGIAGEMAVAGTSANRYPRLVDFFETLSTEALKTDDAGTLTARDKSDVVDSWNRAADAFLEIAD